MKNIHFFAIAFAIGIITPQANAGLITSVPGPNDQGGMLMPMVTITGADSTTNPTRGNITISFNPLSTPALNTLEHWSPGSWFAETSAWRPDIGSPAGIGGTPPANAGNGDLFNNQYGFMFMANPMMGMANIPGGKSLAIRLTSVSSSLLESYNYGTARWDEVFADVGSQVLWNGSMWHNYFTLPSSAQAGTYSATFQVFIAATPFTGSTGYAQYDSTALSAAADINFAPASVTYTWTAVPEPSTWALGISGMLTLAGVLLRRKLAK